MIRHLQSENWCQMDLNAAIRAHDDLDMDQHNGEGVIEEQWQRYVAAREEALATRAARPAAGEDSPVDLEASTADVPITRTLRIVPWPQRPE
jgi:hypothetical protein